MGERSEEKETVVYDINDTLQSSFFAIIVIIY